jgi:imidazolonepropionase-like amidohydrolase
MKSQLFYLLLTVLLLGCSEGILFEDAICFTNIDIIDAQNGLQKNRTVVIKGDRIVKIAPSAELTLSSSNNIIDGTGKYMIPGLWDAHVHFAYIEDIAPRMFDLFLTYGITSVRDTGGKLEFVKQWKDRSLSQPTDAPRVMIAGPLLDGMPNVYDGSSPGRPPLSVGAGSVVEAKKIALDLIEEGVDLLKAYEMLTPDQFVAVVELAKQNGLKITGHVPLSMDVISASNAGLSSMEHLRNLEMSCAENSDELLTIRNKMLAAGANDQGGVLRSRIHAAQRYEALNNQDNEKTEAVLNVLLKNQTWQIPTMALYNIRTRQHVARPDWQATFAFLPDTLASKWTKQINEMMKVGTTEQSTQYADWGKKMVKKIHDKGIGIMAGTDCPIGFLTPGISLHEEMTILVEAGLSPLEALSTATLKPAEYFAMDNELGLIQENYIADLIVLDKNPLEDIENTKTIDAVIKSGKYHSREQLDTKLDQLKNLK